MLDIDASVSSQKHCSSSSKVASVKDLLLVKGSAVLRQHA
jgi:hypothetical protein